MATLLGAEQAAASTYWVPEGGVTLDHAAEPADVVRLGTVRHNVYYVFLYACFTLRCCTALTLAELIHRVRGLCAMHCAVCFGLQVTASRRFAVGSCHRQGPRPSQQDRSVRHVHAQYPPSSRCALSTCRRPRLCCARAPRTL
eukprot:SAG11_NODE_1342_length_5154_cov_2.272404_6_plen_143_part_00